MAADKPSLHYHVTLSDPNAHRFRVRCALREPADGGQVFRFASWIRGSYLIRDFAKHIVWLRAHHNEVPVTWRRLDTRSLRCAPCSGPLVLEYEIHAFDPSVRKAYLDATRGFANGTSLFFRPEGYDGAVDISVQAPPLEDWHCATTLAPAEIDARGFGDYRAADWEEAVDHPLAFGPLRRLRFAADGIDHELVLSGAEGLAIDEARLREDLTRICEAQRALFGGEPALRRYLFLTCVTADSYGGLEHRASSALVCARDDLPAPGEAERDKRYRTFLGLCSHEYFHLWNVKRITPERFAVSDLGAPAYTRDLWAYEGVTSYYDDLMLLRAGCLTPQQYLDCLAETMTRVGRMPGRALHSLAESSFEAWTKFYQRDDNTPNATVSYYAKGALTAMLLDLTLRRESRYTLDDVMRALWQRYGRAGKPAPEGALEAVAVELCGDPSLAQRLDHWIRGTEELPLAEALAAFGVSVEHRIDHRHAERHAWVGLRLAPRATRLAGVVEHSPAQRAGLSGGDELVAVDGMRLTPHNIERRLLRLHPAAEARIHYFRDHTLHEAMVLPDEPRQDLWRLRPAADPDTQAGRRRDAWLGPIEEQEQK